MQFNTASMIAALQTAINQIAAFAVAYSFSVLGAIVLIVVGYVLAGAAQRWTWAGLSRIRGFDVTLARFLSKTSRYAVLVIFGVTVLAQFGVQTASILAALGAVGLGVGLALQGTLQNIAAGIMLLALKPFRVGEYVAAGSLAGTVQEIGLFATELKTFDGIYVLAPNSQLWNTAVTNYSRNGQRMQGIEIGIAYTDDIDHALKTLLALAAGDPRVLADPAPTAFVSALGDSSVNVTLRYWTTTPNWWQAKLDLTKAAKQAFDEKGLTIPFPQRDIHHFYPADPTTPAGPSGEAHGTRGKAAPAAAGAGGGGTRVRRGAGRGR